MSASLNYNTSNTFNNNNSKQYIQDKLPVLSTNIKNFPSMDKSPIKTRSISPKNWILKYRQLNQKYTELLEYSKEKQHKYQMQNREIKMMRYDRQRDQKQMYRLRSMLGFIKKQDKGVQVCEFNYNSQKNDGCGEIKCQGLLNGINQKNIVKKLLDKRSSSKNKNIQENTNRLTSKSNSPKKYQELRYKTSKDKNKTLTNDNFHKKQHIVDKQEEAKTKKYRNIQGWRYRTQSLLDTNSTSWKHLKNIQKQTMYKNIKNGNISEKNIHSKINYEQQTSRLSNSPYSKTNFYKNKS